MTNELVPVARLKMKSLEHDGSQWLLNFAKKGGKAREIPVRHDLEQYLLPWLDAAGPRDAPKDSPLFRSAIGKTRQLTARTPTASDLSCATNAYVARVAGIVLTH